MNGLFEKATRSKFRYKASNGNITTEDLWDLTLPQLDVIARALNKEVKDTSEESFIGAKTTANETLELKLEVVKQVISVKLAEKQARLEAAERAEKKAKLLELISQKENEQLGSKSLDELKLELANL